MDNLTFSDVLIVPKKSNVSSREDVDVTCDMGKFKLRLPVISANMEDVTGIKMAITMAENGGLGIMHRYQSIEDAAADFALAKDGLSIEGWFAHMPLIGVSIGVKEKDRPRFMALYDEGAGIFCIDASHGHHVLMEKTLQWIKDQKLDREICIIAGNVATREGASDLLAWGADIIKVGIGPGAACTTRRKTGVGVPQLKALESIRWCLPNCIMIADGGYKNGNDFAKALKYANASMTGSCLAGTSETPGKVYPDETTDLSNRRYYKVYRGSASAESHSRIGRENKYVEGMVKMVDFKGEAKYILSEIKDGIQGSCSMVGAFNLNEFKKLADLEVISTGAMMESKH